MRVLAEIIASDVSLLVKFHHAIDSVIQSNPKGRANPKALAQLDGYKRPLVSSLSGNLQRFGIKVEILHEIIAKMRESENNAATAHQEQYAICLVENAIMTSWQENKP